MLRSRILVACLGAAFALPAAAQSVSLAEGKVFFERYVDLSNRFDVAVAELYLDGGRVRTLRRYPTAQDRRVEMSGAYYKSILLKTMPYLKERNERSRFRNVEYQQTGETVRVEADRWALGKCYWDHGYFMVIGRQPDGRLRIVEEYSETMPLANCRLTSGNFSG